MSTAVSVRSPSDVAALREAVIRLARRMRKHSGVGLTPSQLSALSTLARHGALRVGDLAAREQIGKSSVTRLVARLEALGLVARHPDATDARSWRVELTRAGRELLATSSEQADAYLVRQLAALPEADQRRLVEALPALERLLDVKA